MHVQPQADRLLDDARALLREVLLPDLPPERRHAALMVGQAMAIAARALRHAASEGTPDADDLAELQSLASLLDKPLDAQATDRDAARAALLEANRQLCHRVRRGDADTGPWRDALLQHLLAVNRRRLDISHPGAPSPSRATP